MSEGRPNKLKAAVKKVAETQQKGAQEALMEEIFHDMYHERKRIYKINFVRGIFFGFGSVIGGTIVIALVIWILSLFVNFPVVGDFFRDTRNTIEQSQQSEQ